MQKRETLLGQRGCVVWFTGLPEPGKSTLARQLEARLVDDGRLSYVLDGDNLRHGLCNGLGFSPADRQENIRRAGEVAALLADAGVVTVTAFISPYRSDRAQARSLVPAGRFLEVHVATPLAVCEERDPKGLYKRARAGEIADFTGVNAPYEMPEAPELRIDTSQLTPDQAIAALITRLRQGRLLDAAP